MLDWHDYRQLPYKSRQLAVQAYMGEVMFFCQVDKVHHLPEALNLYVKDIKLIDALTKQSYFYKKFNGEPLGKYEIVETFERAIPNRAQILFHPLWALFNSPTNELDLLSLAQRLHFSTAKDILTPTNQFIFEEKELLKLLKKNTYDSFAAVLFVSLSHPEYLNEQFKIKLSKAFFKFLIRFITPRNPKIAVKLNTHLINLFGLNTNTEPITLVEFVIGKRSYTLPTQLMPSTTHKEFKKYLTCYKAIFDAVKQSKNFNDTTYPFSIVMANIVHDELPKICQEINDSLPPVKHRTHKPLNRLRYHTGYDYIKNGLNQTNNTYLYS